MKFEKSRDGKTYPPELLAKVESMSEADEKNKPTEKATVREMNSDELLRGQSELQIRHGEELYRLKLTRSGKLILQK